MTSRQEARNEIRSALNEIVQHDFNEAMEAHRQHLKDIMHLACDCRACCCPYCGLPSDNPFCCTETLDSIPYDPYEFDPFED